VNLLHVRAVFRSVVIAWFGLVAVLFWPVLSKADSLSVTIANSPQNGSVGQTLIFEGKVTNSTGMELSSTDLFFDFFGYDPNLTINQLLGTPDFLIPNGFQTGVVNLFSVTLGSGVADGALPIDFVLQDANGNLSSTVQVMIENAPVGTPEPTSELLLTIGLGALLVTSQKIRGIRDNRSEQRIL